MPPPSDSEMRAYLEALFEQLAQAEWISGYYFRADGSYGLKWTTKGRERSRWVKLVRNELDLGPEGLTTLMTVCHQHAPEE
jgi:hypothetical protein